MVFEMLMVPLLLLSTPPVLPPDSEDAVLEVIVEWWILMTPLMFMMAALSAELPENVELRITTSPLGVLFNAAPWLPATLLVKRLFVIWRLPALLMAPPLVTVSLLFNFFSQLLQYHGLPQKDKGTVAKVLRVNPYFVGEYATAARNYPMKRVSAIVGLLREADVKSKGVGSGSLPQGDLLKELLVRVMGQ